MSANILPDSRARTNRGSVKNSIDGLNYIPIYCANCGMPYGMVPEELVTGAFALCEPCAETHGPIAHTYQESDSVFWERVRNAQLEAERRRALTPLELAIQLDDPTTTMAKLAAEWRARIKKER